MHIPICREVRITQKALATFMSVKTHPTDYVSGIGRKCMIQSDDLVRSRKLSKPCFQVQSHFGKHWLLPRDTHPGEEGLQWLPPHSVEFMFPCEEVRVYMRFRLAKSWTETILGLSSWVWRRAIEIDSLPELIIVISSPSTFRNIQLIVEFWVVNRELLWIDSHDGTLRTVSDSINYSVTGQIFSWARRIAYHISCASSQSQICTGHCATTDDRTHTSQWLLRASGLESELAERSRGCE